MEVALKNSGRASVRDWTIALAFGSSNIYTSWSATFSGKTAAVVVKPSGTQPLEVGAEFSFGFCANGSSRATITSVSQGGATGSGGSGSGSSGSGGSASGGSASGGTASGGSSSGTGGSSTGGTPSSNLYTQTGTDPSWEQILRDRAIPIGVNSTAGVLGSKIDVNNALVEVGAYRKYPIDPDIMLHTVGNSAVPYRDFPKWSRWYQEDGNTQVMRLFKGEYNVRNDRPLAARIMAHSRMSWGRGIWHEWVGRFTFVKAGGGMIFQVFNSVNQWAFMLGWEGSDVVLRHRRGQPSVTLGRNMIGKGFDVKVRDNGTNYEVFYNGALAGSGSYDRPAGANGFYWGMYVGETEVKSDGILLVTGATVDP
jgi:hypothetical protein